MNNKVTLNEMHNSYMKMYNLLRLAEMSYPEGPDRDKAYSVVATTFGKSPEAFEYLV